MEPKKNPKVNTEKMKSMFFLIGAVFTLTFVFIAFEWKSYDKHENSLGALNIEKPEEEIIPITQQEEQKPPPPKEEKVVEEIEIVDDEEEIEDEVIIEDTEADEDMEIEEIDLSAEEEVVVEEKIFQIVEDMPTYPGGEGELLKDIQSKLEYPDIARENNIAGIVYVTFVVDKDGSVTNAQVLRGVHPSLDNEALRVVKLLKKFKPGKQRGKPVKVQYNIPIRFVLE